MAERLRRPFVATAAARQLADIAVSPTQAFYREVATSTLRCECVKQSLRLLQIARIEPFSEPAIDRSEKIAGLIPLALIAPEPRYLIAARSSQDIACCARVRASVACSGGVLTGRTTEGRQLIGLKATVG